jgi:hypothetical protein
MRFHHRGTLLAALLVGVLALSACSDTGGGDESADADGTTEAPTSEAPPEETESTPTESAGSTVITIAADTVSGPLNIPEDQRATAVCVLQSRFARNSEIVWRARVFDGFGEQLDDTALQSVQVQLADGQTFDMRYGPHPRDTPADFFWTASFDIPADYPTGTLGYEIVATAADGTTGTFEPFNVTSSLLTITDEVLEQIEDEEA